MEIREVTSLPEGLAAQAKALYERSFPKEELNDFEQMMQALGGGEMRGRPRLIIAWDEDKLLGLSFFKYYPKAELGYLWYIAVDESTRGSGIGTKLYRATLDALVQAARESGGRIKGLIFEVERLDSEAHPIFGDPIRRVKFYERLGARLILGYDYWQPPIPPHGPVPLQLMFHPLDLPESECTSSALAHIITDFLRSAQDTKVTVDPEGLRLQNP
jgi:GNAT superfamily N-acetyltransferase